MDNGARPAIVWPSADPLRKTICSAEYHLGAAAPKWYYQSRNEPHDPVSVLRRKRRQDAGEQVSMTTPLRQALLAQYDAHKSWGAQLHHDNLVALAETRSELRPVPSYATIRRFLAAHGLTRRRPMTTRQTEGALAAAARLEAREVRSYEAEYVGGLWHWDCHFGSRKILTPRGEWATPVLFGVLDDPTAAPGPVGPV